MVYLLFYVYNRKSCYIPAICYLLFTKTKVLDSTYEYKECSCRIFNALKNKLVSKDSCAKGDNISHSIDLKLKSNKAHKADAYKTTIKLEVEQK